MNVTSGRTVRLGTMLATVLVSALVVGLALGAGSTFTASAAEAIEVSAEEKAGLVYMVEEEKLARDVYAKMSELWGLGIFRNISNAEQRHIDHVRVLLNAQGIGDPTASAKPGEFTDGRLQELYDDLVKKGSASLEAALLVGAAIEDIDISDLEALKAQTTDPDIVALYDSLIAGSENHMRSFAGQLKARGFEYKPEHISPARYSTILTGSNGHEGGNDGGHNGGHNGGNDACGPDCDCEAGMGTTGDTRNIGRSLGRGLGRRLGRGPGEGQRNGEGHAVFANRPLA